MTFAAYNSTLPNPPDDPADDVSGMQQNSSSISSIIAIDHVGFNVANGGYHKQITFTANQAAPGIGTGVSDLYANLAAGQSWPFWQNAAAGSPFQMLGASSMASTGYATLGAGLIIQWGGGVVSASGTSTPFTFPVAFNNLFSITIGNRTTEGNSPGSNNQFIKEGSQSVTGFSIVNSSSSSARLIYYIAIGN